VTGSRVSESQAALPTELFGICSQSRIRTGDMPRFRRSNPILTASKGLRRKSTGVQIPLDFSEEIDGSRTRDSMSYKHVLYH
jgi:hypothetical protein